MDLFESTLIFWRNYKLNELKATLDSRALDISRNVERSTTRRARLRQLTRDFKQSQEKEKQLGPLLKSYQEEIDSLTKRAKSAENAFLELYQPLHDAPDPAVALESVAPEVERVRELEYEKTKLQHDFDNFRKEAEVLQNQDLTISRVNERVRTLEADMDRLVQEQVTERERVLAEEYQRNMRSQMEHEQMLARQNTQMEAELARMKRINEEVQGNLFDITSRHDEEMAAKQSEYDLLAEELQRTSSALMRVEQECETLRREHAEHGQAASSNSEQGQQAGSATSPRSMELSLKERDAEIDRLREQLHAAEQKLDREIVRYQERVLELTAKVNAEEAANNTLRQQIDNLPSQQEHKELQRKLQVMSALGYDLEGDTKWNVSSGTQRGGGSVFLDESLQESVERLLKEKQKQLETEITKLKLKYSDVVEQWNASQAKNAELETLLAQEKELNMRLEDDLAIESAKKASFLEKELSSSGVSSPSKEMTPARGLHGSSDQLLGAQQLSNVDMLPAVCAQRDRFRNRNEELERECRKLHSFLDSTREEIASLRSDNLKLYQKIRYLESYNRSRNSNDVESGRGGVIDDKYSKLYDESMNPFALFARREKHRSYQQLNVADKVVLRSGTFFLSNKYMRHFLLLYSLSLHILVFFVLSRMQHHMSSGESSGTSR